MLLPRKLYVNFCAEGVRLCEASWRGVRAQALLPVAESAAASPWLPWVQALEGWLAQRAGQRFDMRVVLSDRFVRYQLLPWRPGLGGRSEWQAYAGHRFREVFGDLASAWSIRVALTPPGEMALASAVDAGLIEALSALTVRELRFSSLQSRFVARYNLWRRKLKSRSFWFASLEPGRVCIALIDNGRWRVMRNEGGNECSAQDLPALLRRIELAMDAAGAMQAPVYLSGDLQGQSLPAGIGDGAVHALLPPVRWSAQRSQLALARGM